MANVKANSAWARALSKIAGLGTCPSATLPWKIDKLADIYGSQLAFRSVDGNLSYRELARKKNQYARWTLEQDLRGHTVCLMLPNCVEYVPIWCGIIQVGGTAALINTNLRGRTLGHVINVAGCSAIIADLEYVEQLSEVLPDYCHVYWLNPGNSCNCTHGSILRLDACSSEPLPDPDRFGVAMGSTALYIYTSGTTGMPKAAKLSHYRIMEWGYWFSGMLNVTPEDTLYNSLPMYHSTGGVAAISTMLLSGGTVVIRRKFSTTDFWKDVVKYRCTILWYIGELCAYLTAAVPVPEETRHELRALCGNGLSASTWRDFVRRFGVSEILEFYASTEGNISLYNCEGRVGSIGRVPPYLAHRFPIRLVRHDEITGRPARDEKGRCVICEPGEVGEAIGKIDNSSSAGPLSFDGYNDTAATLQKTVKSAIEDGDAWFLSGDLMRCDEAGFFYFVDRIGDTFRCKGENVSTVEVSDVLRGSPGVIGVSVYGVTVPGGLGKVGMADLKTAPPFNLASLRENVCAHLPRYARPMFLRFVQEVHITSTFKPIRNQSSDLAHLMSGAGAQIYVDDCSCGVYRPLEADEALAMFSTVTERGVQTH